MPIKEVLQAILFVHRVADDKDIERTVNCIPDSRMKDLEAGLKERQLKGEFDLVQIGRMRKQAAPFTPYEDEVDEFLSFLDEVTLPVEFTGFDGVNENR